MTIELILLSWLSSFDSLVLLIYKSTSRATILSLGGKADKVLITGRQNGRDSQKHNELFTFHVSLCFQPSFNLHNQIWVHHDIGITTISIDVDVTRGYYYVRTAGTTEFINIILIIYPAKICWLPAMIISYQWIKWLCRNNW